MKEIWKDVVGYEGYYQVSNLGKVRALQRNISSIDWRGQPYTMTIKERMMNCKSNNNGYIMVSLSMKGVEKRASLHRIILEAFIGPCPDGMECRHLDGDKSNNIISNLKWGTKKENCQDRNKHGTCNFLGSRNKKSKLSEEKVIEIRKMFANKEYTRRQLSEIYNVHYLTMCNMLSGKFWSHVIDPPE